MKAPIAITIAVVVLIFTCLALGAAEPDPDREKAIARLQQRVRSLEQRVGELERKLRSATTGSRPAIRRSVRPPVSPSRPSPPRGWRRREFNGVPYYIIPIEQQRTRSAPRKR